MDKLRISPDVILAREKSRKYRLIFFFLAVAVVLLTIHLLMNPADTAVIDKRFAELVQGKSLERDSNSVITMEHQKPYNPDYVVYKTKTSKDQLAVFSEVYYAPDWRAYIDGKPADYFRANYILRAMVVPAGEHTIEFKCEAPKLYKLIKVNAVSGILFVLLVAGGLVLYYRKPKKEAASQQ